MAKTKIAEKGSEPKAAALSPNLVELPDLVVDCILKYLPYEEVAKMRILCRRFNGICERTLNRGWSLAQRMYDHADEETKAKRDLLLTISVRLLTECYRDFMDLGMCCFIPGKVLDLRLSFLSSSSDVVVVCDVDELSDLSGKAMKHFRTRIAPGMKQEIRNQRVTIRGLRGKMQEMEAELGELRRRKDESLPKEQDWSASGVGLRRRRRR